MAHLVRGCSACFVQGSAGSKTKRAQQWSAVLSEAVHSWSAADHRHVSCAIPTWPLGQRRRTFSSKSGRQQGGFLLDALTFTISPEEALDKFQKWAVDDQGLNFLMSWKSIRIGAAYVPVWSFDLNIRFVLTDSNGKKRYDWKPSVFSSIFAPSQSVMHLPGLSAYAGYSYRRSLLHPLVNTSLVFLGNKTTPFEKFMLRDMKLQTTGEPIEVVPDPWNATRAQSFATLVEDLENLASGAEGNVVVQTEIISSRRVYLPVYVIDYSILGIEYRAFTSGCDVSAGVSGVDHTVLGGMRPSQDMTQASQSFLSNTWVTAQGAARALNSRQIATMVAFGLQFVGNILGRFILRIPVFALFGSIFVGLRKIVFPFIETRRSSAAWERQREQEKQMREGTHSYGQDFSDGGKAHRYFERNREKILRYLGGTGEHEQGDFDWYKDWEEWARRQWQDQQQQQQQYQDYGQRQQQQQQQQQSSYNQRRTQKPKSKPKYRFEFDENDPYSVLGIRPGATKAEVSAAFRREILKHQ